MKFLLSFLALLAVASSVSAAPGDKHAREHQNTPLWINVPVPKADLDAAGIIPAPLEADLYNGTAYVQFLSYNLDKLETYLKGVGWIDVTLKPGWVTKINILVKGREGPGYLITSINFEKDNNFFKSLFDGTLVTSGIRYVGSLVDQKIESHMCPYIHEYSSTTTKMKFDFDCTYPNKDWDFWNPSTWFKTKNDYFKTGEALYTKGTGNGIASNDFVRWAVVRNIKYEHQKDGSVVWADEKFPGIEAGLDSWYPLTGTNDTKNWSANILTSRLGLKKDVPLCQKNDQQIPYCFWADYYGLIDHENTILSSGKTNDAELVSDPLINSSSSPISSNNNMIWLYGILVGIGSTVLVGVTMFAALRYRAKRTQVVQTTTEHVQMP